MILVIFIPIVIIMAIIIGLNDKCEEIVENSKRLEIGMSFDEVVELFGEPTSRAVYEDGRIVLKYNYDNFEECGTPILNCQTLLAQFLNGAAELIITLREDIVTAFEINNIK